jgi:hypothetical protein
MTDYEKDKDFLSIVETNVYNIPQRLKEYDKRFFVVRNHKKQTYEVHYEDNKTSSYCFTVPYKELDARTLYYLQENDVSRLGEAVFKTIYDSDDKMEKNKEKNWKKYIDKVARESHHLFKEAYWGKSQF